MIAGFGLKVTFRPAGFFEISPEACLGSRGRFSSFIVEAIVARFLQQECQCYCSDKCASMEIW